MIIVFTLLSVTFVSAKGLELSANAGLAINPQWDPTVNFGITASKAIAKQITAEVEIFYYLQAHEDLGMAGIEFSSYAWNVNLYGHYSLARKGAKFNPYVSVGAGIFSAYAKSTVTVWGMTETNSKTETKLNAGFGGGFKYALSKKSGLRFDARYMIIMGLEGDIIRITAGYYKVL